jgi:hypothetical protein
MSKIKMVGSTNNHYVRETDGIYYFL